MRSVRLNNKASILLEVLLTIVIMSVSLTFVVGSFLSGYRAIRFNEEYSRALLSLDQKMAELAYGGIEHAGSTGTQDTEGSSLPEKFKYSLDVQPVSALAAKDLSEATMAYHWKSGGKPNAVSLSTYVFNSPNE